MNETNGKIENSAQNASGGGGNSGSGKKQMIAYDGSS